MEEFWLKNDLRSEEEHFDCLRNFVKWKKFQESTIEISITIVIIQDPKTFFFYDSNAN
jgi:hypothetical protein